MIQPTEYITMTRDGKMIHISAVAMLTIELADKDGQIPLHRIIKELQMARDGVRRPEPWAELEKKLLQGEITEQEFIKAIDVINAEEARRMSEAEQTGQPHEHI